MQQRHRIAVVAGLVGLLIIGGIVVALASVQSADASGNHQAKGQKLDKILTITGVDSPTTFQGVNPFPTKAQPGQKLVAVTIDFDRDFKDHLRSSADGEVYLSDLGDTALYHTVDTAIVPSDGPGKKPSRIVTFVFAVPQATGLDVLFFHYGTDYTLPLLKK